MKNVGYKHLAYEYDDFYRNKDYPHEVAFITKYLQQRGVKSLLDVGCGTGTHMALLEKQGFQVQGLDLNEGMLNVAKTKVKGSLHHADMTHFTLPKKFDAILCLFAAFNHNLSIEAAAKTLHSFKKHLAPQGILLIDLYNTKNSGSKIDEGKEVKRKMDWTFDPETQTTKTSVTYTTTQGEIHQDPFAMRHFSMEEMRSLLAKESFTHIEFWDNFSDRPGTPTSKNLIVTAALNSK